MKHTQIPQEFDWTKLEWCDQLVFAQIKRFMNKQTRRCYPSMSTLSDLTKLSVRFLNDSIDRLESFNLIDVTRRLGASNIYYFPPETDQFEMFSEDFLDLDLPPKVKEYYMKIQKCLLNKEDSKSFTHYSDRELAKITGLSSPTVKKYNEILEQKGVVTTSLTPYKDDAGFALREMTFDMQKLGQFGLWAKAVTKQLQTNTEAISNVQLDVEMLKAELKRATEQLSELKRQNALKNNEESTTSYKFQKK